MRIILTIIIFGLCISFYQVARENEQKRNLTKQVELTEDRIDENLENLLKKCGERGATSKEINITYDADGRVSKGVVCKW
jgi:hypothetical protein